MMGVRQEKGKTYNFFKMGVIVLLSLLMFMFFLYFFYTYIQGWRLSNVKDDFILHIDMALYLVECIKNGSGAVGFVETAPFPWIISYPVWHLSVYVVYAFLYRNLPGAEMEKLLDISAGGVSSVCLVITWLVVTFFLLEKQNIKIRIRTVLWISVLGISLLFVGPLDASKILGDYYLGAYSGNLWHNSTYLIMRPVGLMTFLAYSRLITNTEAAAKEYILGSFLLATSAVLKPNFYQSFLPGLAMYCIISFLKEKRYYIFYHYLKIAFSCLPVCFVAIIQYTFSLGEDRGGIGVGFLYVWKHYTENWIFSLVVSIAFPACIYIIAVIKQKWNVQMGLSLAMFISALTQYMIFYVKAGPFAGDFSWGVGMAIFIGFVIAVKELYNSLIAIEVNRGYRLLEYGCFFLYSIHLWYGIVYFFRVWTDRAIQAPLFIQ